MLVFALAACSVRGWASVIDVSLDLDPTVDISHAVLLVQLDSSSVFGAGSVSNNYVGVSGTNAGVALHQDVFLQNYFNLPVLDYTVYSIYGGGAGVAVGIDNPAAASVIGSPWPFNAHILTTEPSVQNALNTGNADVLDLLTYQMRGDHYLTALGSSDTIVAFSTGRNVGTIKAAVVPEPASLSVLALGGLALFRRRKHA